MGVFRIARAEFIKIFKKPSIYLMGVILAAVLVLSLLFFDPIGKQNYTVTIDGSSVEKIYDKFMDTAGDITKETYDKSIQNSLDKINFYKSFNNRNLSLTKIYNEFVILYKDLETQNSIENNEDKINSTFTELKNKFQSYCDEYNNVENLSTYSELFKTFYYNSVTTKSDLNNLTEVLNRETTTPTVFINYVVSNTYLDKMESINKDNKNFIVSTFKRYSESIKDKQTKYYTRVTNNTSSSQFNDLKDELYQELSAFYDNLISINKDDQHLAFMVTTEYENLKNEVAEEKSIIEYYNDVNNPNKTEYKKHQTIVNQLNDKNIVAKIDKFIDDIIEFKVSNTTLEKLENTINTKVMDLKESLNADIEAVKQIYNTSNKKDIDNINSLISKYKVLALNTENLVNDTIDLESIRVLNSNKITKYIGFEKFNVYETKEELTKTKYMIDKGTYNQEYSDVFAFNKNSSTETTAYDFMFYGMEIATLIISIFAIFLSASLIASEYDSGTIKLLAMRPFNRWKIITGKLVATMIFALLFVLFSFIICFVAGICMYPLVNTPILMVFNATSAVAISPFVLMLLDLLCILAEIFFYTVIALSISTIFRSYTSAISISCIMFILATSFNLLFGGYFWYSFIPFINADFFKFFGGSFLTTQSGAFNTLFTSTLLSNANFFMSLGIWAGTITIFLLITYITFKLRDF